ncbi:MAG: gamma-D-glutamyl-meso-diaminopimelate peptidase [Clostridia bacterium]|nr:gamma-D-glutamyl-meso-diaminopimelate peptidase [Clostridia bacterium]
MKHSPFTLAALRERLFSLSQTYAFLQKETLANSYFGTPIEALRFGCGKRLLVFVGCHHGSEYLTSFLLLDFAEELARCIDAGERRYGLDLRAVAECRRLVILPCLNPDGMQLATEGLDPDSIHAERLLRYHRNNTDFSHWQANGRGVDLNHNYNYRFDAYKALEQKLGITAGETRYAGEYPESEPETRALARLIRTEHAFLSCVLSFHSQGEVIYYHDSPLTAQGAAFLARTGGYILDRATGLASYGGLTDWLSSEGIPAYTIEIGKGENPLPTENAPYLYASLREMLFRSLAFF